MDLFNSVPTIESANLRLRRITMHDAPAIYEYSKDERVAEHVLWTAHRSVFETRSYIRWMIKKYRNGEPASWGIALKSDDRIIGTIGFMWIQPENAAAEVGYSLSRRFWNRGIMTEALAALISLVFWRNILGPGDQPILGVGTLVSAVAVGLMMRLTDPLVNRFVIRSRARRIYRFRD